MAFDERKARRAVRFIEALRHTKGEFHGQPFRLLPWQEKIIRDVFGTVRDDDLSMRQYTTAYIEIPKKNGKSELGAAIALNMLINDDEWKAEVYSYASDRQQAAIVFDVAVDMVRQSPALMKRIKIIPSMKRMVYQPTGSIYQVLSSEVATKHGLNVSACIFDELHTQPTRALYDVMTQGSGDARKQPLWFLLTTAGTDRNSICWEVHQKALDILEGRKIDPRFYPVLFGLPDDADWTSEENWYRANPSLDHTITIDKVRDAFRKAQETPADENQFPPAAPQPVGKAVRALDAHGQVGRVRRRGGPLRAGSRGLLRGAGPVEHLRPDGAGAGVPAHIGGRAVHRASVFLAARGDALPACAARPCAL